jgi:hypothetical protein
MKNIRKPLLAVVSLLLAMGASVAQAQVKITEFAPWSSGSSVGSDWFELTNFGATAINLAGWSMDDSSANAGSALLTGIAGIDAGQSVIFMEGDGTTNASFISTWFGTNAPAGFSIGNYAGSGVGLSTSGDAVNLFNAFSVLQANVSFAASTNGYTFDNAAGLTGSVTQLSAVGIQGAFANAGGDIGSPGAIAAAVPEPETYALMLAGLGLLGAVVRRRRAA